MKINLEKSIKELTQENKVCETESDLQKTNKAIELLEALSTTVNQSIKELRECKKKYYKNTKQAKEDKIINFSKKHALAFKKSNFNYKDVKEGLISSEDHFFTYRNRLTTPLEGAVILENEEVKKINLLMADPRVKKDIKETRESSTIQGDYIAYKKHITMISVKDSIEITDSWYFMRNMKYGSKEPIIIMPTSALAKELITADELIHIKSTSKDKIRSVHANKINAYSISEFEDIPDY